MGLRPTLHYLQVYSVTREISLSARGVPHTLLTPVGSYLPWPSPPPVWLPTPFTGYSENKYYSYPNRISSFHFCHCVFRYLDAVDSYTRISPLHRTRDYWHFQTLTPCHRSRFSGFGFAYHKAFYYSRLSTATFTCDNFSTIAFLSPTGIQLIFHNTSRGPVSRSILLSSPPSLTSPFLSTDIASVLHWVQHKK